MEFVVCVLKLKKDKKFLFNCGLIGGRFDGRRPFSGPAQNMEIKLMPPAENENVNTQINVKSTF